MYLDGLYEELIKATNIELRSWIDKYTDEVVFSVERYGQRLWVGRLTRATLVDSGAPASFMREQQWNAMMVVVNDLFDTLDWDTFYT